MQMEKSLSGSFPMRGAVFHKRPGRDLPDRAIKAGKVGNFGSSPDVNHLWERMEHDPPEGQMDEG